MKRSEVRAFIKSGVAAVSNSSRFNSGRLTEFNSNRSNNYPFIWLESLSSTSPINQETQVPHEEWKIVMHIAKKDAIDSKPEEYETIIDECDLLAQQLVKQYNIDLMYSDQIVIESTDRKPFHHKHADDTTGVILSFTLIDYRSTDVC